jgi:hypothetical protein
MSSEDLLSKREAERFYTKAVKEFDRWFFSLTKDRQASLRDAGVKPYREMRCKHYVYPVNTKSETQVIVTPWDAKDSTEHDTFYSREKVEEFTRRLMDTLGYSLDPRVRLHFLLVKLALKMPDAIDGKRVAKLFGITKAGVSFRVQRMRAILSGNSTNEKPNGQKGSASRVRLQQVQGVVPQKCRDSQTKGKAKVQCHKRAKNPKG